MNLVESRIDLPFQGDSALCTEYSVLQLRLTCTTYAPCPRAGSLWLRVPLDAPEHGVFLTFANDSILQLPTQPLSRSDIDS